ncbi:putative quinol monooxygenase [Roseiarcus sp.]|uniref:putative quinol monooxygenase n=1 Tax=Roseiarcus sp. TaxID=1969460 RepID=UPI003C709031
MSPSPDTAAGATPKLTLPPGRGSYDSANVAHSRRLSVEAFEFCGLDPPVGGRSHDDGTIGYEVLPEADHPNHFTVIEEWTTSKSRDAHLMAAHTRAFRERLLPKEGALYDARIQRAKLTVLRCNREAPLQAMDRERVGKPSGVRRA